LLPIRSSPGGEQHVDAELAVILNSLTPVFAFLINMLVTRHEWVTGSTVFGVVAGLVGICLVVGPAALNGFGAALTAQLVIVFAAVAYGAAVTFGRTFRDLDPMMPAAGSLVWGAAILIQVSLIVDSPWMLEPLQASIMALLALSLFSTALAFVRDVLGVDSNLPFWVEKRVREFIGETEISTPEERGRALIREIGRMNISDSLTEIMLRDNQ